MSPGAPKVKICGVTRVDDTRRAVELGADLIGLNFYPPSPRCLTLDQARELAEAVAGRARLVGVFVNKPLAEVEEIDRALGLDLVQLHGEESPEYVAHFGGRALKVVRTTGDDLAEAALTGYPQAWGFLFDVRHPKLYGGSGVAWRYSSLADLDRRPGALDGEGRRRPVLVAGGVTPTNAARAARESRAWGIDVCSGVESSPGIKDPELMNRLFEEVGRNGSIA